jgi:hypothetical protein
MGFILEQLLSVILDLFMLSLPRRAQIGCFAIMVLALIALFATVLLYG